MKANLFDFAKYLNEKYPSDRGKFCYLERTRSVGQNGQVTHRAFTFNLYPQIVGEENYFMLIEQSHLEIEADTIEEYSGYLNPILYHAKEDVFVYRNGKPLIALSNKLGDFVAMPYNLLTFAHLGLPKFNFEKEFNIFMA